MRKTSVSDSSATDIVTITVPNGNHAAAVKVFGLVTTDNCRAVRAFEYLGAIARQSGNSCELEFKNTAPDNSVEADSSGTANHSIALTSATDSGSNSSGSETVAISFTSTLGEGVNIVLTVELINFNSSGITMAAS